MKLSTHAKTASRSLRNSLLCSGPFNIIDTLRTLVPEQLESLLLSLDDSANQPIFSQAMFFQRYLERYLPNVGKGIEAAAIENHRKYAERNRRNVYPPYALARFSPKEQSLITSHLVYIQATHGCGGDCIKGCGVDAVSRVRDRIPLEHIIWTLEKVAEHKNRKKFLRLYFASDPLEIASRDEDFFLISQTYFKLFNRPLDIVTSIPKGTEDLYKEICKRKTPFISLCVSITEQNIERLNNQGILNQKNLENLALLPGSNVMIYPGTFVRGYNPHSVNLITEPFRENVGINRYTMPAAIKSFWNRTALLMTPYGLLNTIAIPRVDREYPEGRIVVSVDYISDRPFKLEPGEPIDYYLTECIVSYSNPQESPNRSFYLSNLSGDVRVLINEEGKILLCDTNIFI